jgi:hypothetical protein
LLSALGAGNWIDPKENNTMSILQFPITLPVLDEKAEETRVSIRLPGSLPIVDVYGSGPPGGGEPLPEPDEESKDAQQRKAA